MKKKIKIILISVLCVIIAICTAFGIYVKSGYKAETPLFADNETSFVSDSGIRVNELESGNIEFVPEEIKAGLIFYPGGNVEYTAYAPLLEKLSEKGILCVLVRMPFNLAVFDSEAASGIKDAYPDIDKWYISGHSLGGAMAGTYVSKHPDEFDGLILLAAYSSSDISGCDIDVMSVYGEEDGVLNRESYEKYRNNLPESFTEYVIDGGCHSYFGDYGMQKGDGTPKITRDSQLTQTADYIEAFISW